MAYVPPARRGKASTQVHDDSYSAADLRHHYWPPSAVKELPGDDQLSTLNSSAQFPFHLAFVLLHRGQNPLWKTDGIVFAKTNLKLLPDYFEQRQKRIREQQRLNTIFLESPPSSPVAETGSPVLEGASEAKEGFEATDDLPEEATEVEVEVEVEASDSIPEAEIESQEQRRTHSITTTPPIEYQPSPHPPHPPIAAFEEQKSREFRFVGWYMISQISLFAPYSQALVEMLQQKWTVVDQFGNPKKEIQRDSNNWAKSLKHEWASIGFQKMEGNNVPAAPKIDHVIPRKSVNELLAEIRLGDKENAQAERHSEGKENVASA